MKALALAVLLAPTLAMGQTFTMSYQGRLLDNNQAPVVGTRSVTFSLYGAGTGGSAVWTETQTVQLTNGFYAVQLGAVTPLTAAVFNGSPRWLGVKVGTDAEMTPRQFIATVPYAFRAQNAETLASKRAWGKVNADGTMGYSGGGFTVTVSRANTGYYVLTAANLHNGVVIANPSRSVGSGIDYTTTVVNPGTANQLHVWFRDADNGPSTDTDFMFEVIVP